MNWINSWNAVNKKEVYEMSLRLCTWTLFEFRLCPCATCTKKNCSRFRFM